MRHFRAAPPSSALYERAFSMNAKRRTSASQAKPRAGSTGKTRAAARGGKTSTRKIVPCAAAGSRLLAHVTLWDLDSGNLRSMAGDGTGSYSTRKQVESKFGAVSLDRVYPATQVYYPLVFTADLMSAVYALGTTLLRAPSEGFFVRDLASMKRYRDFLHCARAAAEDAALSADAASVDSLFEQVLAQKTLRSASKKKRTAQVKDLIGDPALQRLQTFGQPAQGAVTLWDLTPASPVSVPSLADGRFADRPKIETRLGAISITRTNPADSSETGLIFADSAVGVFRSLVSATLRAASDGMFVRGLTAPEQFESLTTDVGLTPATESELDGLLDAL